MDTGTSSNTTTQDNEEGPSATTTANAQPGTSSRTSGQNIHPPVSVMADILDEVMRLNERLQPHMESYRDMMRSDHTYGNNPKRRRDAQRLQNLVAQVMHLISHVYHSLSDCGSNMITPPPRVLRVPQAGPPVPIQINLPPAIFAFNGGRQPASNQPRDVNANQTMPPGQDQNHNQTDQTPATQSTTTASSSTASTASTPSTGSRTSSTSTASATHPRVSNMVMSNTQTIVISPQGISNITGPPPRMMGGAQQPQTPFGRGILRPGRGGGNGVAGASIHIHQVPHQGGALTPQVMSALMGAISRPNPGLAGSRPHPGPVGSRPHLGPVGSRPNQGPVGPRLNPGPVGSRPNLGPVGSRPASATQQPTTGQRAPTNGNRSSPTATSTSSTSSSNTRPRSAPTQSGGVPQGASPLGLFNMLPQQSAFDPFLPCQSRHIYRSGAAQNADAASVATPIHGLLQDFVGAFQSMPNVSQQQQQQPPQQQGPQSSGPQPAAPSTAAPGSATANAQAQTQAQASSIANAFLGAFMNQQAGVVNVSSGSSGVNPFVQLLIGQSQRRAPPTGGARATPGGSTPASGQGTSAPGASHSNEGIFVDLMQGISQHVAMAASGQNSTLTIHQFLSSLDPTYNSNHLMDGFFFEAFDYFARNFTMTDLSHLIFGQSEPLQQNRQSLRRFVNEKVLRGRQPSEENITISVNEIAAEIINQLEEDAPEITNVREGVAIKSTNLKFVQNALFRIVNYILEDHDPTFGVSLRNMIRDSLQEWIVLNIYCMNGQQPVLDTMVACMRTWMGQINSVFGNLMISMTTQNFNQIVGNLTITEADILQYVVRTESREDRGAVASSTSDDATSVAANGSVNSTQASNIPEAMEVDSCNDSRETSAPLVSSTVPEAVDERERVPVRASSALQANGVGSTETVLLGTESWHAAVPADWVPVIERDINRQRRQAPQAPLSDAYLSTLPPKRIKLMQDKKAHIQSGTDTFLEESLCRAVNSAGVQPTTSLAALMQDAREDEQLQAACEDQLKSALKQRIQKDPDYDAARFPSTDKYLRK